MKYLARSLFYVTLAGVAAFIPSFSGCDTPVVGEAPADMVTVTTYSCDLQTMMPPQCKEFSEISANQSTSGLETLCTHPLTPGPCSRTSSYGGCRNKSANYTYTVWFYPGGTMFSSSTQVQAYCATAYVPPT